MSIPEGHRGEESHFLRRFLTIAGASLRVAGRPFLQRVSRSRNTENPVVLPGSEMNPESRAHFESVAMAGMSEATQRHEDRNFDIFDWYPRYQSCQRYFLDRAQHSVPVQALSSFLNILLPFQRQPNPVFNSAADAAQCRPQSPGPVTPTSVPPSVSLVPYIRRLVATGMDYPGVLHGFFGDDWVTGIGPLHEQERRNYLFAAKSGGWAAVKRDYDIQPLETIPFLRPLQSPVDSEIEAAERGWSEWLAMEDWMVGPRAPDAFNESSPSSRSRSA
uniref:Ilp is an apoptosis inhibitor n=1 Tax=Coccidioides posadasii RMSCC 3488 TaxID=454284 RepID=A0A0J6FJR2_COCPO|nr:hypothetical protein CPAG_09710 [Coccidioides posadasii RMSCC 3488]